MAKLRRGQVVVRPDSWEQRGKYKRGKAIVMSATARKVVLCTFNPGHKIDSSNPHLGVYSPSKLTPVGNVKRIPKACKDVLKWKKEFWRQHPFFARPKQLGGASRRKRRK